MANGLLLDVNKLHVFHEGEKRRMFVGELFFDSKNDIFIFEYDDYYQNYDKAIPVGPELDLFKKRHTSKKNELFSSFQDRIPAKENPAYPDYCLSQGISVDEENPIVLLCTIGKRGPSSFVFESIWYSDFNAKSVKIFREKLSISQHDLALALDVSLVTLQRIEAGKSQNQNVLKVIELFSKFPEVAKWQLQQTSRFLHRNSLKKFVQLLEK